MKDLDDARLEWITGNVDEPAWLTKYLRRSKEYIIEDEFKGEMLSVEAIASAGKIQIIGLLSRILNSSNPTIEMGSCFPYPHKLSEKIISLVCEAHTALGLTDGPSHTEIIVNSAGDMEIIDLNPRFVGADVLQSINHAYGTRIQEALFDFTIGLTPKIFPKSGQYSCIQYFLPPEVPVITSVDIPGTLSVKFSTTFMHMGWTLKNKQRQIDYLGCYLTVMPTFQEAIDRSRELRDLVKINNHYQGVY